MEGSPPRVRGKDAFDELFGLETRITPACAGKRHHFCGSRNDHWDHPRVCGEKAAHWVASSTSIGSPPRVRGKD